MNKEEADESKPTKRQTKEADRLVRAIYEFSENVLGYPDYGDALAALNDIRRGRRP